MQILTTQQYETLLQQSKLLVSDAYGEKVIRTEDNDIWKIFRRKRTLSSAIWKPYAVRFVQNAHALKQRGIQTVNIKGLYSVPSLKRHMVRYEFLEGMPLTEVPAEEISYPNLAHFIAHLHQQGVYFRSLHFGNILQEISGEFALIDISDMHLEQPPLSIWKRARNFKALFRKKTTAEKIAQYGRSSFIRSYLKAAELNPLKEKLFLKLFALYNSIRA